MARGEGGQDKGKVKGKPKLTTKEKQDKKKEKNKTKGKQSYEATFWVAFFLPLPQRMVSQNNFNSQNHDSHHIFTLEIVYFI